MRTRGSIAVWWLVLLVILAVAGLQVAEGVLWPEKQIARLFSWGLMITILCWPGQMAGGPFTVKQFRTFYTVVGLFFSGGPRMVYSGIHRNSTIGLLIGIAFSIAFGFSCLCVVAQSRRKTR